MINIRSVKRITSNDLGTCRTQKMKTERRGKHVHATVSSLNKKLRCMLPTQVTNDKVVARGRYASVFQEMVSVSMVNSVTLPTLDIVSL